LCDVLSVAVWIVKIVKEIVRSGFILGYRGGWIFLFLNM